MIFLGTNITVHNIKSLEDAKIFKKSKNLVFVLIITSLIVVTVISYCFNFSALSQNEIIFTPNTEFSIPSNNGSISFAFNGTYEKADLENNFWSFTKLRINNTQSPTTVNLKVSAQDSMVRIGTCRIYNSTFTGERAIGARVRYTVAESGIQVFYLGLDAKQGDWSVIVNDNWIGKNQGCVFI